MLTSIIKNKIIREIIKRSKDSRPDSYPYISGDGFRKMANHIHDETQVFNPEKVNEGDIVFVKSDMLIDFFEKVHPKIKNKYKLISHNSDKNITEEYLKYVDSKIIHWFAQNLMFEHPKVTVIPIGLENRHIYLHGIPKVFNKIKEKKIDKKDKILFGFNTSTNSEAREGALRELRENPKAEEIKKKLNNIEYLKILNQYKYVASPPGNGVDCHRTWEAIVLGTIPICLDNKNSRLFKKIDAPIVIVKDYKKIDSQKINTKSNFVEIDYWYKTIKEI